MQACGNGFFMDMDDSGVETGALDDQALNGKFLAQNWNVDDDGDNVDYDENRNEDDDSDNDDNGIDDDDDSALDDQALDGPGCESFLHKM